MWRLIIMHCFSFFIISIEINLYQILFWKNVQHRYTCALYRFLARPMGLVWEVRGGQHLACGEAFIVANHQSALDLLGLAYVKQFDGRVLLCPKKEVLYYWPLGLWAYLVGDIFLDKSNPKAAYRKLEMAMRSIMNQKMTPRDDGRDDIRNKILLFPEGIRNRKPDFLPFKKGAFVTAIGAGVPIVPMIYSPYYFLNRENMIFNDGRVILKFLEPISTSGLKPGDAERLAEEVRQKMFDVYNELGEEIMLTLPKNYPMEDKWKSIMLPKTKTDSRTV